MWRCGLLLCGLAALATVGLAGCSSAPRASSSGSPALSASASDPSTTSVTGAGAGAGAGAGVATSAAELIPPSVPNDNAARRDVLMPECSATNGGWSAGGVAKNPTASTTTFIITVFFANPAATDLDYAQTTITVPAHDARFWSVKATFRAPSRVDCILRGVATT
jgi:hypothetical protein